MHKIHFTKEKETLLITLRAKALDSRLKNSLLNDTKADEILSQIDYDFEKFSHLQNETVNVLRARQLDEWVNVFLSKNKKAVVINLGCGLDTRFTRINPSKDVLWFDVDYPEVIGLRKNFYSNSKQYIMIESSVTNSKFLEKIPKNRPVMIVAEGIFEYLLQKDVQTLLNRLTESFSEGRIAFDVINSFAQKAGKKELKKSTGATHTWAVDDPKSVDILNPKLKRISTVPLFSSRYVKQLSTKPRILYTVMNFIPPFRTMLQLLQYEF